MSVSLATTTCPIYIYTNLSSSRCGRIISPVNIQSVLIDTNIIGEITANVNFKSSHIVRDGDIVYNLWFWLPITISGNVKITLHSDQLPSTLDIFHIMELTGLFYNVAKIIASYGVGFNGIKLIMSYRMNDN